MFSVTFIFNVLMYPANAVMSKVNIISHILFLSDKYAAVRVPNRIPKNDIISNIPLPNETPSSPPMSRINPYFEGEYKQLMVPIKKTVSPATKNNW